MVDLNSMMGEAFNADAVEPAGDFSPVPEGEYLAVITESQQKATKAGTGHYLELKFQIIEGEHKNRLLWARLNLDNPNQTAVNIAKAELSSICRAVGILTPGDSAELHDKPLKIKVVLKKREDNGEMTNEIKAYKPNGSAAPAPVETASASGGTPPWQK
jgi:hypothetical protein